MMPSIGQAVNKEQIEVGECLLPFCAESFVFGLLFKKCKD
jgi:hypothetical protein